MSRLVPPIREVKFGSGHHYVDSRDERADGVTDIGKRGIPSPALVGWGINGVTDYAINHWDELAEMPLTERQRVLRGAPNKGRDEAAHKGKEVHRYAQDLIHGRSTDKPDELAGYIDSCVAFLDDFDPQPVLTESLVYSLRHGYAGRLDAIVDMRRRLVDPRGADTTTRQLIDYKTGKAIYPDASPQLTAYAYAEHYLDEDGKPQPMLAVDGALAVHLRSDGYEVYPVEISPRVFRLWQYAQQVAAWMGTWDWKEKRPTGWCNEVVGAALPRPIRSVA